MRCRSIVELLYASAYLSAANALTLHGKADKERQMVHWVFTTDCSAQMFNQGNVMLASADHVDQPGEFTWIMYGCDREEQKKALKLLAHPRARVWHMPEQSLKNPTTGQPVNHFQASNRPLAVGAWYQQTHPPQEAIGILDPDMMWLRRVELVESPREDANSGSAMGSWQTSQAAPKIGSGARYGQGCIPSRWDDITMVNLCNGKRSCVEAMKASNCSEKYASGPPWIIHRSDADSVFRSWLDTAIKVHDVWPDLLAEQVSYGVTQMQFDVSNKLDSFWFLSGTSNEQPWDAVARHQWDPCSERSVPPIHSTLPPIWHACSTYEIPHLHDVFRLHKGHIHKDLLDCDAPLLNYPPKDSLVRYRDRDSEEFRQTWSVCTYTNVVNFYATRWKKIFCERPNLEATFAYPHHSTGFLNEDGWLAKTFRTGGWEDVNYQLPPR